MNNSYKYFFYCLRAGECAERETIGDEEQWHITDYTESGDAIEKTNGIILVEFMEMGGGEKRHDIVGADVVEINQHDTGRRVERHNTIGSKVEINWHDAE